MYVIVGGAGEVGYHVARALRDEGNDVAVVERDADRLDRLQDLDVLAIPGDLASKHLLETQAEVQKAELFIACTGDDHVNMVASALAKSYGARTIARINNPDYLRLPYSDEYQRMGIDVAVCPEMVAAIRIKKMLNQPSLVNTELFAQGKVTVAEGRVTEEAMVAGKRVDEIDAPPGFNLFAIYRGEDVFIPKRDTVFHIHDRLMMVLSDTDVLAAVEQYLGSARALEPGIEVRRVMIAGATRVGVHLARLMEQSKRDVVLVEQNPDKCVQATDMLRKSLIVHGDATDRKLLVDENVDTFDAFIGATQSEEYNVLSTLMAKREGVDMGVCLIQQTELKRFLEEQGIDLAVAPRLSTVGAILKHVHKDVEELSLKDHRDERIVMYRINEGDAVAHRTIKQSKIPKRAVVAAVLRGDEMLLPRGDTVLEPGDRAIIFTLPEVANAVERLFT